MPSRHIIIIIALSLAVIALYWRDHSARKQLAALATPVDTATCVTVTATPMPSPTPSISATGVIRPAVSPSATPLETVSPTIKQ